MNLGVAFRAFFGVLFNSRAASLVDQALRTPPGTALPAPSTSDNSKVQDSGQSSAEKPGKKADGHLSSSRGPKSARNDAISLLSTLQREARLLDLVQESLDNYSDAQVGAAARDVLRDSQKVLKRLFDIKPLHAGNEGDPVAISPDTSAFRTKLVGANTKSAQSGVLVHPGWIASTCRIPQWTGNEEDAMVIAPAEVEVSK